MLHSFQGFVIQVVNRKTDNNILIFSENRFFYSIFHRVTAVNCPFVNVFSAKFGQIKVANPDGDTFWELVTPVLLLFLGKSLEFSCGIHLLLALDNEERLVQYCSVDKETVFCALHLDVQKSARASRRKRIHDDFAALRHPKSACVIEGVFELLDLVVTVQIKEPVKEIFESLGTVEQLLKTGVVSGINECLSGKFSGNRFLAYNILSFERILHHLSFVKMQERNIQTKITKNATPPHFANNCLQESAIFYKEAA